MEYNKFPLNYYILQISDLDVNISSLKRLKCHINDR